MLKMTIKYKDFNDEDRVEDHYFNLTKPELIKMQITGENNDYSEQLRKISKAQRGRDVMEAFEFFVRASYGLRLADGRFVKEASKNDDYTPYEISHQTGAYDAFFMELVTDAEAGSRFINGIMPPDLIKALQDEETANNNPEIAAALAEAGEALSARQRSEQNLQGHKKKADHEASVIVDVPSSPVATTPAPKPLDQMSAEELEAELARRKSTS